MGVCLGVDLLPVLKIVAVLTNIDGEMSDNPQRHYIPIPTATTPKL